MPAERLDDDAINTFMADLPSWTRNGDEIRREVKATDFLTGATKIVPEVAQAAEDADHHPDIDIRWRTLIFTLTTHDAGGITTRDFDLARKIDRIAEQHGAS